MYELILEGVEVDSHSRLIEILRGRAALSLEDIQEALRAGPVTVDVADKRNDLLPLYRDIEQIGGRVSIISRSPAREPYVEPPHIGGYKTKCKTLQQLEPIVRKLRGLGRRIVLVQGVFDILHIGDIRLLNAAREQGDILIVAVISDREADRGAGVPQFSDLIRQEALANLAMIDFVTISDSEHAVPIIESLSPDVLVRPGRSSHRKTLLNDDKVALEDAAIIGSGGRSVTIRCSDLEIESLHRHLTSLLPPETTSFLVDFARRWNLKAILQELEKCNQLNVLVIGDTIIDRYHYCQPLGKSAKENLIVNKSETLEDFAGGVIATANHVAQLCKNIELVSFLGNRDTSSKSFLIDKLDKAIVPYFFHRESGPTTCKKRYLAAGSNQKLFEICDINDEHLSETEESKLCSFLAEKIDKFDLVVVNDFGHGMLTPRVIELISARAKCLALNVQVNGANQGFNLVTNYKRADFVCIDERELRLATRDRHSSVEDLMTRVSGLLDSRQMIATRGAEGSMSWSRTDGIVKTPAFASSSVDKVGAGDAFFAYTAPCFAAGLAQDILSVIGNCVGALKIQIVGNKEQVQLSTLLQFLKKLMLD